MEKRLTCQQPDRDCPNLICGYPLPCPHHTVIMETDGIVKFPPEFPADAKTLDRVIKVARILKTK